MTSAVATGVHYAVLAALVEGAGAGPAWSAASGAACGAFVAYVAHSRFTFRTRASHRTALPRFLAVAAAAAILSAAVVLAGTRTLHWHYLAVQGIATGLALILGYRLNRAWSFA